MSDAERSFRSAEIGLPPGYKYLRVRVTHGTGCIETFYKDEGTRFMWEHTSGVPGECTCADCDQRPETD